MSRWQAVVSSADLDGASEVGYQHELAVAVYNFDPASVAKRKSKDSAESEESEEAVKEWRLHLLVGDVVALVQECDEGWYFGHPVNNPGLAGVFPKSYVTPLRRAGSLPPIADEISAVLRDWNLHLREKFLCGDAELTTMVPAIMREVMNWRTSLVCGTMTVEEVKEVQRKVTTKMDFLNHRLGLDLVVRDATGNQLSPDKTSGVAFYRQHLQGSDKIKNMMLAKPREAKESPTASNSFRIMMMVKNFVAHRVSEVVELVFSIYEASESKTSPPKPLCESYVVQWDRRSQDPREIERRNNLRVLFADISKTDITNKRLFLICNVSNEGNFRGKHPEVHLDTSSNLSKSTSRSDLSKGPIGQMSSRGSPDGFFRKPVGVAAVEITDLFTFKQGKTIADSQGRESEHFLPLLLATADNEPFESVFRKLVFDKKAPTESKTLWVTLNVMLGDLTQPLEASLHHHHHLSIARKIGLPEVILPSDFRNDLYVTLLNGEFSRMGKGADRNVEVTVEVCDARGAPIPNSITGGVGAAVDETYRSVVFYHEPRPKWNEVTKVMIPVDQFTGSHLRFTFVHRSSKSKEKCVPWAMAYLKLVHDIDKTAVRDDTHELLVYKVEKKFDFDQSSYLELPYLRQKQFMLKQKCTNNLTLLPKDVFVVQTTLCSTKLTQNEGLLSLLKWRDEPEKLKENLNIFNQKVNGKEFVKFLPDVLDALFSILTEKSDNEQDDLKVFKSIIDVIHLITEDLRYQQFVPVLDVYICHNFSATLAYSKLLSILKECADNAHIKQKELIKAMKSLKYVFKFVVQSRTLFAKLNGGKGREVFEQSLRDTLESLVRLMYVTTQDLYKGQIYCLQHMVMAIPDLVTVFSRNELSEVIIRMTQSLPEGHLRGERMTTLKELVKSILFSHQECRALMLPEMSTHIKATLAREDADPALISMCTETLGDILMALHAFESDRPGSTVDDVSYVMFSCLRTVIQMVANRKAGDKNVPVVVSDMISLLRAMTSGHFEQYISKFTEGEDPAAGRLNLVDFVMEFLVMSRDLIEHNVFPPDWLSMILLQNASCLKAVRHLANTIRDSLNNPFEYQAWSNFFTFAVAFVTQPPLQLERFSENKRQKVQALYRDMRREMGSIVKSMWINLGQHKIRFIPEMVGPFLDMTMIPETDLRKEMIPVFFDMMQCEYYSSKTRTEDGGTLDTRRDPSMIKGNFKDFEREIIDKLDVMVEAGGGDEHYKALFKQMMMAQCESHTAIGESGTRIVKLVTRQQELLLEYRTITQQEESKENQMSCIVNVLDFYKGIDRDELYVKYLKKLCSLHEQCQNWAEAAFTLLQYSDSLEWSERPVKHIWKKHASCRTQRALKEQLCRDAIKNFEKGKMWEKALDICKDLAKQYEEETYDYPKLADLYQKIAGYYRSIMTEVRPDAEYFRVAFWGRGFPAFLQNKIFVYRGKGYEKLPDFQTRILDQFPNAKMMTTLKTPSDEEKELGVQLLQINKVDPVMGVAGTKFQGKPFVQQQIINYYKANEVRRFTYSRPFTRGGVNKENEFANLWIERTVLQTKYTFPGVLQWFVLCQPEELFELCPIDNAIETMQKANEDLRGLIMDHANPPVPPPLNPLTMKLNGTIDAAVNGGTAKYEQAFFTDEYLEDNPEHEEKVRVLKDQIANQIPLLDACIKIHDLKKTDDLQPLHDRLEGMFKTMRTQVEAKYGKRWCDITVRKANTHGGVRKGSMNNTNGGVGDVATMRRGGPQMHSLTAAESKMDLTRASFVSQGSLHDQSASKTERVFSALGISRKRSGAQDLSRTSVGRLVGQISSTAISENGGATGSGGSNGSSNTSSIDLGSGGGGSGGDANWSSPTVVITQTAKSGGGGLMMSSSFHGGSSRPTSGQFLNSSTPLHSRSPSIASNRESIVSVEENTVVAAAPPVPPKSNRGSSDAENTSMSSFDYEEKPTDREEYAATRHIIITARKRAPPPPPPPIQAESDEYAQSPPTPPRKPQFGTPFE